MEFGELLNIIKNYFSSFNYTERYRFILKRLIIYLIQALLPLCGQYHFIYLNNILFLAIYIYIYLILLKKKEKKKRMEQRERRSR